MKELAGKTAVVTGAASGIGLATARAFAREGMKVVLADVEEDALREVEDCFKRDGAEVLAVTTDVSNWGDVERLAEESVSRFQKVHVIHNNAGVVLGGPIADLSLSDWEWVLGVDLWGVIHGVKAFLPLLREAGEGHIVNTSSSAGFYSQAAIAPYNVAKHGVVALTETLRRELRAEGSEIGASVLCPGMVTTRILESDRNRPSADTPERPRSSAHEEFQQDAMKYMAERGLDPEDAARLVVDGVQQNRFWILTHPDWIEILRERIEGMADGGRLTAGFGG